MDQKLPFEPLYKVLSLDNWQASEGKKELVLSISDNLFIHLSTKEQLDQIIDKYWADVESFFILKIDPNGLEGRLVFEANSGGSNKYYHLYEGSIPMESILEAKHETGGRPLPIVEKGDLILMTKAKKLTLEELLSDDIQQLIKDMKVTMRKAPGVGVAAPQVGRSLQIVVIEDMNHSQFDPNLLKERERFLVPFHVIINPRLTLFEEEWVEFFEGCLSVPRLMGKVPRARRVKVECWNEKGEPVTIEAKGWYARILQHEIDHLQGSLYLEKATELVER